MRTSISFNLSKEESAKTQELAKSRGFETTSDYLRFLISQDDADLISEHELVKRSKDVDNLHKANKLIKAKSLADFMS